MLAAFDDASVWLNSPPLRSAELRGRVVAVDFWTYSCVNWLRTLPYVRAWQERYAAAGLVVVGVHAPEFGFEHASDNVRDAIATLDAPYPVVIDNEFAIWRAFGNRYWPALYLLDGDGRVRFSHFGEEAYEESERAIQTLLGVDGELVQVRADDVSLAADWGALKSPETYLGGTRGERRVDADALALNQWRLGGDWSVGEESATLASPGGSIAYRFEARDVNLVLAADTPVPFTVRLDGKPPDDAAGVDVDETGAGVLSAPRMYQLIRQADAAWQRTFEITFAGPGVHAYVFTFG
ncbi:redoxin family protein [Solirubrobacter phytolaccae]|uniref:Redoxin family protein n=1 Tax=Solirubrobacter phytolaccae TaxID=1404360 RepID=A0A9X3SEW4_9ACTN|nr:redoxin family protein [Solirubrobacter phytolaccae]MDA0185390.1 redoxin family protein [Solirubrobacter phytolaccae]